VERAVKRATRRSAVSVYEVLREHLVICWACYAMNRPERSACACGPDEFERGEPVTVRGWMIPRDLRGRFRRWDWVTVYPDGRAERAEGDADGRPATDGA
jgi:hypothetical protein